MLPVTFVASTAVGNIAGRLTRQREEAGDLLRDATLCFFEIESRRDVAQTGGYSRASRLIDNDIFDPPRRRASSLARLDSHARHLCAERDGPGHYEDTILTVAP